MNWWIWRPVMYEVATFTEIMGGWDIDRLIECHEALNLKLAIEAEIAKARTGK